MHYSYSWLQGRVALRVDLWANPAQSRSSGSYSVYDSMTSARYLPAPGYSAFDCVLSLVWVLA